MDSSCVVLHQLGQDWQPSRGVVSTNTLCFLRESTERVASVDQSSSKMRMTVYQTVYSDLVKLADIDPALSPAAHFAALYTQCMLLFTKILSTRNWLTLSLQQSGALKSNVDQLLKHTFCLRHAFTNLSPTEEASIRNLRVHTHLPCSWCMWFTGRRALLSASAITYSSTPRHFTCTSLMRS